MHVRERREEKREKERAGEKKTQKERKEERQKERKEERKEERKKEKLCSGTAFEELLLSHMCGRVVAPWLRGCVMYLKGDYDGCVADMRNCLGATPPPAIVHDWYDGVIC